MPLPQQLLDRVFDQPRIPMIPETLSQSGNETRPLLDLSQQQHPCIGGDLPAVEPRLHFALK